MVPSEPFGSSPFSRNLQESQAPNFPVSPTPLSLRENVIHVWFVPLRVGQSEKSILERVLSAEERERVARYKAPELGDRFLVGRGRLRNLLGSIVGEAPDALQFQYGLHGKPALIPHGNWKPISFNVAHSGDSALIAIGWHRDVGVDIEKIGRRTDQEGIAKRFFAKSEAESICSLPPPQREKAFLSLWTCKEAYIKAIGWGLSCPLDRFEIVALPGEEYKRIIGPASYVPSCGYSVKQLSLGSGYVGAVASQGSNWEVCCWQWSETDS